MLLLSTQNNFRWPLSDRIGPLNQGHNSAGNKWTLEGRQEMSINQLKARKVHLMLS